MISKIHSLYSKHKIASFLKNIIDLEYRTIVHKTAQNTNLGYLKWHLLTSNVHDEVKLSKIGFWLKSDCKYDF